MTLRPKTVAVLHYLVEHAGRVVTRETPCGLRPTALKAYLKSVFMSCEQCWGIRPRHRSSSRPWDDDKGIGGSRKESGVRG